MKTSYGSSALQTPHGAWNEHPVFIGCLTSFLAPRRHQPASDEQSWRIRVNQLPLPIPQMVQWTSRSLLLILRPYGCIMFLVLVLLFLFFCFKGTGFSGGCLWTARTFFAWLLLGTRISSYPALSSLYWFPLIMELTSKIFNFLKIYISISEIFNIFALPNPAAGPRF